MTVSRATRRAGISDWRRTAKSEGLLTWLVSVDTDLSELPALQRTAQRWLSELPTVPPRKCMRCKAELWSGELRCGDVGGLLLSVPAASWDPNAAIVGVAAVCRVC